MRCNWPSKPKSRAVLEQVEHERDVVRDLETKLCNHTELLSELVERRQALQWEIEVPGCGWVKRFSVC